MRHAMIAAAVFVTVIGAVLALFWALQRGLMYFPTAHVPTPAEIGLTPVESVTFKTADGLELSGWFLAASGLSPRLAVLVFNGNAGNRGYRGPLAATLGVVARIVTGPHDAHRQDSYLPMRYDTGRPRAVI